MISRVLWSDACRSTPAVDSCLSSVTTTFVTITDHFIVVQAEQSVGCVCPDSDFQTKWHGGSTGPYPKLVLKVKVIGCAHVRECSFFQLWMQSID